MFHSLCLAARALGWDCGDAKQVRKTVVAHLAGHRAQYEDSVYDQTWEEFLADLDGLETRGSARCWILFGN